MILNIIKLAEAIMSENVKGRNSCNAFELLDLGPVISVLLSIENTRFPLDRTQSIDLYIVHEPLH